MPKSNLKLLACLVAAISLTLIACGRPEADLIANLSPEAKARTVPIVRPFKLVPMAEPLVVEFDAREPSPNATSQLAVGLRVRPSGSLDSAAVRDRIRELGLAAEIHLTRIDQASESAIRLEREGPPLEDGYTTIPVEANGVVPGVVPYTLDITSLINAGIVTKDDEVRAVAFAWVPSAAPGKYRLSVRLIDPSQDLSNLNVDLLVAYQFRYK